METNYHKSRRSKRKLCYLNERSSSHWEKPSSLIDADRLFDDFGVCADLFPTCAALQSSDSGTNQSVTSGPSVPQENHLTENSPVLQILSSSPFKPMTLTKITSELDDDVFQPATTSPHLKLDLDLDIPFKAHGPVKTSSPIEQNMCRKPDDQSSSVFPVLFNCETEAAEEPDENPPNTQKPQCNGRVTDNSDGEMEFSPSRVSLMSLHKELAKATRQEQTEPCVPAERPGPEGSAVKNISVPKRSPAEMFSRSGKDMTSFLQKVKQLIQSKPPKNSAVKAPRLPPPPPPESEEDFFILEDDAPLWISIPSKSSTKRRQKLSKASSSDKESFTKRELKDSSVDMPQEQQPEPEKANNKPESQVVDKKNNNRKKSSEKNTESENCTESLPGSEEIPDPVEQQEPKKKKQTKKSKESNKTKDHPAGDPEEQPEEKKKQLKVSSKGSSEDEDQPGDLMKQEEPTKKKQLKKSKESNKTKDHPAGDPEEQQEEKKKRLKASSKQSGKDEDHPGDPEEQEEPTKKKRLNKSKESNKTKDVPACDPEEQQEEKKKQSKASSKQNGKDEDHPGDLEEQEEPTKKKRLKKVSSKGSDEAEGPERVVVEAENSSNKTEPKKQKSTRRKNLKEGKAISPTVRADSLQKSRKQLQGSTAVASGADEECQEQGDEEPAGTEHLGLFSDKEADRETKQKQSAESGESSSEDVLVCQKRKRRPTGQWWLTPLSAEEAGNPLSPKKSKQNNSGEPRTAPSTERVRKDKNNKKRVQKQPVSLSSDHTDETKKSKGKQTKKRKTKREEVKERGEIVNKAEEQQENPDQESSSPLVFTHRDLSLNSGSRIFHQVYHHSSSENMSVTSTAAEEDQPREPEPEPAKRRRRPPSNWWEVNNSADVSGSAPSQPRQLQHKEPKPKKEQKKQSKQKSALSNMAARSGPPGGALVPLLKPLSAPKTVKRSLATFKDIFTSVVETPTVYAGKDTHQSNRRRVSSRPAEQDAEFVTGGGADGDELCGDVGECSGTQHNHNTPPDGACQAEDSFMDLKSGPSSLINLETFEDDDADLPKSRAQVALSASDLCAPPLKPLTLHSKDKADLTKWFQSLWSFTADDDAVITAEHFQWYFYKDRAMGIQADLNSSSICHGKILMGSYMKKPLWVDHSATTVFNLATSSVMVTIDGRVSRYSPGQAFMVECGQAYSIHNTNAQPAILYFTRISAESSD